MNIVSQYMRPIVQIIYMKEFLIIQFNNGMATF